MKKMLSLLLAAAMLFALLAGCSGDSGEQGSQQTGGNEGQSENQPAKSEAVHRDTVTVAVAKEPKSLIPSGSNDTGTSPVTTLIYETLLNFDENMELTPCLATEWEQIDDTHFRFKLRDDVYFHNGDKMTAEDVLYTFQQSSVAPATANTLGPVDVANSVVEDEHTIVLALSKPFAPFLNTVALGISGIVNKKAMEADPDGYAEKPIGTGPFKYEAWNVGDSVQLEANDEWWGGAINFDHLVLRLIPEATTRAIEAETGGVDIAVITASDASEMQDSSSVNLIMKDILNVSYLSYNCSKEPFNDIKVRQAISCAIDADTIVKNTTFGLAERSYSAIAPNVWGYYNAGEPYGYDVERAKQLIAESGYPDGFTTTLLSNNNDTVAEMIQAYLKEINITVNINSVDFANWLDALLAGRQDMYLGGWTVPSADAAEGFTAFHSAYFGSGGNRSFYANPELDPLIEEAESEMDKTKRTELYKQIQEILAEEAVYVHTRVGQIYVAVNPSVQGLVVMPTQDLRYDALSFTK